MPVLEESPAFTGPPETHTFAGVLFDMDGTIVDSTDAIIKHWHKFVIIRLDWHCNRMLMFPGLATNLGLIPRLF